MSKRKYLFGIILLSILISLLYFQTKKKNLYIIYSNERINCILKDSTNFYNRYYTICDSSKVIFFEKSLDQEIKTIDIKKIKNYNIISHNKVMKLLPNSLNYGIKNDFHLKSKNKNIYYNLIIKDSILGVINIIPVSQIYILSNHN